MTLTPLPAAQALDVYFLDARSRLLDLAAMLDRIDRGGGMKDPRLERIHQAIGVLTESGIDRAARIQEVFSLAYDPQWKRPAPQ
jgi:hypothetical protein